MLCVLCVLLLFDLKSNPNDKALEEKFFITFLFLKMSGLMIVPGTYILVSQHTAYITTATSMLSLRRIY